MIIRWLGTHAFARSVVFAIAVTAANAFWALDGHAVSRSCTAEERKTADKQLRLNKHDKEVATNTHLPWGLPQSIGATSNEELLLQRDFVINYDQDLLIPVWTAERIVASQLGKEKDRINCFRTDPRLKKSVASTPTDYVEPIFDQGHMTPNGNMSVSTAAVVNSFIMSNMTPQYCQFNRGVWQILEALVRRWAVENKIVYVITGSILDRDGNGVRDDDGQARRMKSNNGRQRVAIPSHFFKIVAALRPDGALNVLTIVLPHDQTDVDGSEAIKYLSTHIRSVADVENVTGFKFFPASDKPLHEATTPNIWDTKKAKFRSLVDDRCRKTAGADFR